MLRFGQQFKRDMLPAMDFDESAHRTNANDMDAPHIAALRNRLDELRGDEIRDKVLQKGLEAAVREFSEEAERERRRDVGGSGA